MNYPFTHSQKASGCLFGMALGDALAAPTEFMSVEAILQRYPPGGPEAPKGNPSLVTDDTQMALAVGEALLETARPFTPNTLETNLRAAFVKWLVSPDNNRAPGRTCLTACEHLKAGMSWQASTVPSSKGCGANMRVAPVGLLTQERDQVTTDLRAAIAQFQSAVTHGHPTALAASDLTAFTVADLASGGDPGTLPQRLRAYATSQRHIYHQEWLGDLWQRPGVASPESFIERGWDECIVILNRLDAALVSPDRESDPCLATGAGWIAEEAFGTGLLCFLLYPDDPVAAIRRAAVTSGDSDSIACLAGAFAGAYAGMPAWPEDWVRRIEYKDRLQKLGAAWD